MRRVNGDDRVVTLVWLPRRKRQSGADYTKSAGFAGAQTQRKRIESTEEGP